MERTGDFVDGTMYILCRRSVNERIVAPTLLIVWEKQEGGGKDSVVMSRRKALQLAKDNELDLVLREYKR